MGDSPENGIGGAESKWSYQISGGSMQVFEEEKLEYEQAPRFQLITSGTSIELQVAPKSTGVFQGMATAFIYLPRGGGTNGDVITYEVKIA